MNILNIHARFYAAVKVVEIVQAVEDGERI